MPNPIPRHTLWYALPLLALAGPFLAWGASNFLVQRKDLQRQRNMERVRAMPDAVVDAAEHDFGVMDALAEGTHTFVIRNQGGGPLELALGESSATTIRGELDSPRVLPGQAAHLRVTWTTGAHESSYRGGLLLETNDTSHREIRLTVHGSVRVLIGAEPRRLAIPPVEPGQAATFSTLVYSQACDHLLPPRATCSIAGAVCTVEPVSGGVLSSVQAKSGYQVRVTLPADLSSGPYSGVVRIEPAALASLAEELLVVEVPFSGRVLRRLAVYGVGVEEPGIVDLGIHRPGQAYQQRLLLKVRDEDPRLNLVRAEFKPAFLQASLAPAGVEGRDQLYHLEITIPADAPQCIYRGMALGEMKLRFDHPRIPELALRLAVAVMPPR